MKTVRIKGNQEGVRAARDILVDGGIVGIPTETVYGLAANANDDNAIRRIFEAKGRPLSNPLIVHVEDWKMAMAYVSGDVSSGERLALAFWPGPLSIVLPKSSRVSDLVTASGSTVALRAPNHQLTLDLIRSCGFPLVAPSANRSGSISPTTAEQILQDLDGRIDAVLDGGSCVVGIESTVIDLTKSPPIILRPGAISASEISNCLGQEVMISEILESREPARSPGMSRKHYSPKTPLYCVTDLEQIGNRDVLISFGPHPNAIVLPDTPTEAAVVFYTTLREVDNMGFDAIYVLMPPDTTEWQAIRDRLIRAQG